jgi:hypothetical protein
MKCACNAGEQACAFASRAATQIDLWDMSLSSSLPPDSIPWGLSQAIIQLSPAIGKKIMFECVATLLWHGNVLSEIGEKCWPMSADPWAT